MRLGRWKCLGVVGATLRLWIPAPYRGTGHAFDRRNDEFGGGNRSSRIGVRDMLSYQLCNYASPGRLLSQENTPPETHADLIRHSDGLPQLDNSRRDNTFRTGSAII